MGANNTVIDRALAMITDIKNAAEIKSASDSMGDAAMKTETGKKLGTIALGAALAGVGVYTAMQASEEVSPVVEVPVATREVESIELAKPELIIPGIESPESHQRVAVPSSPEIAVVASSKSLAEVETEDLRRIELRFDRIAAQGYNPEFYGINSGKELIFQARRQLVDINKDKAWLASDIEELAKENKRGRNDQAYVNFLQAGIKNLDEKIKEGQKQYAATLRELAKIEQRLHVSFPPEKGSTGPGFEPILSAQRFSDAKMTTEIGGGDYSPDEFDHFMRRLKGEPVSAREQQFSSSAERLIFAGKELFRQKQWAAAKAKFSEAQSAAEVTEPELVDRAQNLLERVEAAVRYKGKVDLISFISEPLAEDVIDLILQNKVEQAEARAANMPEREFKKTRDFLLAALQEREKLLSKGTPPSFRPINILSVRIFLDRILDRQEASFEIKKMAQEGIDLIADAAPQQATQNEATRQQYEDIGTGGGEKVTKLRKKFWKFVFKNLL